VKYKESELGQRNLGQKKTLAQKYMGYIPSPF
jgi:hypothetical protein